jgi:hypothetical protein
MTTLQETLSRLEARRAELDGEIRAYPTPIPRCDAQFNHLMEERARVVQQIDEMKSR